MNVRTLGWQSRRRTLVFCFVLICANLTACGQLGPLYLPGERIDDSTPAATTPTDESATDEGDNDDKPDGL